jgi:hypothetical protein
MPKSDKTLQERKDKTINYHECRCKDPQQNIFKYIQSYKKNCASEPRGFYGRYVMLKHLKINILQNINKLKNKNCRTISYRSIQKSVQQSPT